MLRGAPREPAGNYNATPTAWTNDMNDPTEIVNYEMRGGPGSGSFAYWTRYDNPQLSDQITQADLEQDPAKREADLRRDPATIPQRRAPGVHGQSGRNGGVADRVHGFLIDGLSYYRFEDVTLSN